MGTRTLQLLLLALAYSAAVYSRASLGPLQESMRLVLQLTDNQVAVLQGPALGLPIVAASIPLGLLIDRFSRTRLLLLLAMLDVIGAVLTALSSNFVWLLAARSLVGLVSFGTNPVALSLLSDMYGPAERGRAMTVLALGYTAGASASFAFGGVLLGANAGSPGAWPCTVAWLSSPLIVAALATQGIREPARTNVVLRDPSVRDSLTEILRYRRRIAPLLGVVACAEVALGAMVVWAAPALGRAFALPMSRVDGMMATGLLISGLLGPVLGGVLADLCERSGGVRRTMTCLAGLSLACIPAGLFASWSNFAGSSVLLIAFVTLMTALVVMETTVLTIIVPNELRGLCMGLVVAISVLVGTAAAPLVVSLLSSSLGGPSMIGQALSWTCVTMCALSASVSFGARRALAPARAGA